MTMTLVADSLHQAQKLAVKCDYVLLREDKGEPPNDYMAPLT